MKKVLVYFILIFYSAHWFLGLVCYPWMAGMVSYTALYKEEVYHLCQLTEKFVNVDKIEFDDKIDNECDNNDPSSIDWENVNRKSSDSLVRHVAYTSYLIFGRFKLGFL